METYRHPTQVKGRRSKTEEWTPVQHSPQNGLGSSPTDWDTNKIPFSQDQVSVPHRHLQLRVKDPRKIGFLCTRRQGEKDPLYSMPLSTQDLLEKPEETTGTTPSLHPDSITSSGSQTLEKKRYESQMVPQDTSRSKTYTSSFCHLPPLSQYLPPGSRRPSGISLDKKENPILTRRSTIL